MTLYIKYRPSEWSEVAAQNHIVTPLMNALKRGEVAQTLLFTGRHGTGKTTVARILAEKLGAKGTDIVEIDAASNRGIDDARRLKEESFFIPIHGETKVFIIDECHMLTKEANNALLKILEEPPQGVYFVLCTTEISKIPATIKSRCQQHSFKPIGSTAIEERLQLICEKEGIEFENDALHMIARQVQGSMRDGISVLDLLSNFGFVSTTKTKEVLGMADIALVRKMISSLASEQLDLCLNTVAEVTTSGVNLKEFCSQVTQYFHELLLIQAGQGDQAVIANAEDAKRFSYQGVVKAVEIWNASGNNLHKYAWPELELELAAIECLDYGISSIQGDF